MGWAKFITKSAVISVSKDSQMRFINNLDSKKHQTKQGVQKHIEPRVAFQPMPRPPANASYKSFPKE